MISPSLLENITIRKTPYAQKAWAKVLTMMYAFPSKTHIIVEGLEKIPDEPCFLAMNHTDRYNYWPFQYVLSQNKQYTCAWVKAKYFQNWFVRAFLLACNNIPVAPKGTLIASLFFKRIGRKPTGVEYNAIQHYLQEGGNPKPIVAQFFGQTPEKIVTQIESDFAKLSLEVVRLNEEALAKGHHILIFPQGTRSLRLSKGHIGIAQMSQRLGASIVPIGCSGSDKCYPGVSPWAKGGTITYRVGDPISVDDPKIAQYRVAEPFVPFSAQASRMHRNNFQAITNVLMDTINTLVEPQYQYSKSKESDGVKGIERFM